MLKKILEEIERLEKIQFSSYTEPLIALKDVKQMILKHMNDDKCGECSRRKWYQKGYEDGKDINVFSKDNGGWIPCEERMPERTLDEKMNDSYKEYLVFIDSVDGWSIDIAVHDLWNDKKWRETHDFCEIENVIAWRPLPEPYRPEKGAEE